MLLLWKLLKLEKIVVNIGVGDGSHDDKLIEAARKDLETITGQHAVITKAKKSIAGIEIKRRSINWY